MTTHGDLERWTHPPGVPFPGDTRTLAGTARFDIYGRPDGLWDVQASIDHDDQVVRVVCQINHDTLSSIILSQLGPMLESALQRAVANWEASKEK